MTVGDHQPEEPKRFQRSYELIYEISDRARAMAPAIAGTLRAVVIVLTFPAIILAISAIFPIAGLALIAKGAEGWAQITLFVITAIALLIELLFVHRTRQYMRVVRAPGFVEEVAQLIDIADMSDELLARLRGAGGGGVSIKRLGALWDLWRTPNYFTDRIDSLVLVRSFVPPRINFNIKLAVIQFWAVVIMWGLLIIMLIARLSGAI